MFLRPIKYNYGKEYIRQDDALQDAELLSKLIVGPMAFSGTTPLSFLYTNLSLQCGARFWCRHRFWP